MLELMSNNDIYLYFIFVWALLIFIFYTYFIYIKYIPKMHLLIGMSAFGTLLLCISTHFLKNTSVLLSSIILFFIFLFVLKMVGVINIYQVIYTSVHFVMLYFLAYITIYYFFYNRLDVLDINDLVVSFLSLFAMQMCLFFIYSISKDYFTIYFNKEPILILFFSISMMLVLPGFLDISPNLKDWNYKYFVTLLAIGCLNLLGSAIIHHLLIVTKKLYVEKQTKLYVQMGGIYKKKLEEENRTLKKIRHDLKNHLIVTQKLLYADEKNIALKHIQSITDSIDKTKNDIYTNILLIDAYINYIVEEYTDINFDITSNNLSNISISHQDILLLIMNLVDNAIENIGEEKKIIISMLYQDDELLIKVTNDTSVNPIKNNFITTKKDVANHGIGLLIVKDIVEQYNATYITNYLDDSYTVYVAINKGGNSIDGE